MTSEGFQSITSWTLVQDRLLIWHAMVMSEQTGMYEKAVQHSEWGIKSFPDLLS